MAEPLQTPWFVSFLRHSVLAAELKNHVYSSSPSFDHFSLIHSWWPQVWLQNTGDYKNVCGGLWGAEILRLQKSPNHQPSITMLLVMFMLICCICKIKLILDVIRAVFTGNFSKQAPLVHSFSNCTPSNSTFNMQYRLKCNTFKCSDFEVKCAQMYSSGKIGNFLECFPFNISRSWMMDSTVALLNSYFLHFYYIWTQI